MIVQGYSTRVNQLVTGKYYEKSKHKINCVYVKENSVQIFCILLYILYRCKQ